jgi:hypothetical protein
MALISAEKEPQKHSEHRGAQRIRKKIDGKNKKHSIDGVLFIFTFYLLRLEHFLHSSSYIPCSLFNILLVSQRCPPLYGLEAYDCSFTSPV